MTYKAHLFICTNSPDRPQKCGSKGAETFRLELKQRCKEHFPNLEVRVNSSGCLGPCEKGLNAVLYPSGKWFHELQNEGSAEKVFEAVCQEVKDSYLESDK